MRSDPTGRVGTLTVWGSLVSPSHPPAFCSLRGAGWEGGQGNLTGPSGPGMVPPKVSCALRQPAQWGTAQGGTVAQEWQLLPLGLGSHHRDPRPLRGPPAKGDGHPPRSQLLSPSSPPGSLCAGRLRHQLPRACDGFRCQKVPLIPWWWRPCLCSPAFSPLGVGGAGLGCPRGGFGGPHLSRRKVGSCRSEWGMGAPRWGARMGPWFSKGAAAQVCGPLRGRSRVGSALCLGNSAASAVVPAV